MNEVALEQPVVGSKAIMKFGSPVRQWMRKLRDSSRWLTPVHYALLSEDGLQPGCGPQVKIAKVMLPYAIVYHHNGRGWVKLWIDTREVPLYLPCQ